MADAGLRPNEVRALRRRDFELRRVDNVAVGGFLGVREGRSFGQTDTPKTGQREIPLTPRLARLLADLEDAPKDAHVAVSTRG
jgi:integrase